MRHHRGVNPIRRRLALKHDIGSQFRFPRSRVIATLFAAVGGFHSGHHLADPALRPPRPPPWLEFTIHRCALRTSCNPVKQLSCGAGSLDLLRQPFPTVDAYLDRERKPTLQPHRPRRSRYTNCNCFWRLSLYVSTLRQASTHPNTQIHPSLTPSRSAIHKAISSFHSRLDPHTHRAVGDSPPSFGHARGLNSPHAG